MPPRRRRAGYKPGELSEQMRHAISAEAARLDALGDDLATIRATSEVFNALEDAILEIREPPACVLSRAFCLGLVVHPPRRRPPPVEDPGSRR